MTVYIYHNRFIIILLNLVKIVNDIEYLTGFVFIYLMCYDLDLGLTIYNILPDICL